MEATGQAVRSWRRHEDATDELHMHDSAFQVILDQSGHVVEIQLAGASSDSQALGLEPELRALYQGLDIFRTPAVAVIEVIAAEAEPNITADNYPTTVHFPSLGLTLWRDQAPDDFNSDEVPLFDAMLLRKPWARLED